MFAENRAKRTFGAVTAKRTLVVPKSNQRTLGPLTAKQTHPRGGDRGGEGDGMEVMVRDDDDDGGGVAVTAGGRGNGEWRRVVLGIG
ncbi:hypothetical protein Tco_0229386 [Tanacetum coccineum]